MHKFMLRRKYESCDDPGELILSLVDTGALSADDVLVACIKSMSDADCLKVLQHVELDCDKGSSCDDSDYSDEEPAADKLDEVPEEPDDDIAEACKRARLEKRLRRLEHTLALKSKNRY